MVCSRPYKKNVGNSRASVDKSPVRVAVFDVSTGKVVSFNRDAVRIFENLRTGDRPPEELLEILIFRRADGRNVSLRDVSLAQDFSTGETIHDDASNPTYIFNESRVRYRMGLAE